MMRKLTLIIICACCVYLSANAQDPHFSQFYSSPLTLNPAYTGKFDGTVRIAGNYRNQWPTINRAFQTSTVSVDFPILKKIVDDIDRWGVGLMAYTDKGADGAVSFNYLSASTAFHKGLDEDGYKQLGLGIQATYSNMLINTSKLTFEDQLNIDGTFSNPTNETFGNTQLKTSFVDVNAGLLFTSSTIDRNNLYAGVSVYHINRPKQNFNSGPDYVLNPRATFHAGGFFPVGDITTLHLSALYSTQGGAHETLVGGALQFTAGDPDAYQTPVSVYAGAWLRLSDALIPYIGLEFSNLRIGATYDINTSNLKAASQSRGGLEISLIYIAKQAGSKGIPCPKF